MRRCASKSSMAGTTAFRRCSVLLCSRWNRPGECVVPTSMPDTTSTYVHATSDSCDVISSSQFFMMDRAATSSTSGNFLAHLPDTSSHTISTKSRSSSSSTAPADTPCASMPVYRTQLPTGENSTSRNCMPGRGGGSSPASSVCHGCECNPLHNFFIAFMNGGSDSFFLRRDKTVLDSFRGMAALDIASKESLGLIFDLLEDFPMLARPT
mmetsp:Transcript_18212/g.46238  ORF Transcript_18212/g.46238 Transcript_18212/m.46238 type:complete len:210 (-) Transcript_18212:527-1156(-)